MRNKGFTLVELLIVIVILGILGSVMFVGVTAAVKAAREGACKAKLGNINKFIKTFMTRSRNNTMPKETGKDFFQSFVDEGLIDGVKAKTPITDAAQFTSPVFQCPFNPTETITYRAPQKNINSPSVKPEHPIAGDDKEDDENAWHGPTDTDGCFILYRSGRVGRVKKGEPEWDDYFTKYTNKHGQ